MGSRRVRSLLLALDLAPPSPFLAGAAFEAATVRLTSQERARVLRYRRREDQERCLGGALLARRALGALLSASGHGADSTFIGIARRPSGRPYLAAPAGLAAPVGQGASTGPAAPTEPSIDFNLSHAGNWVVCVAARGARVGVDVEQLGPLDPGIFPLCLAPAEQEALLARSPADRPAAFLSAWTAKEAYLKALGTGLAVPLTSLAVSGGPPRPGAGRTGRVVLRDRGEPVKGWRLAQRWLDDRHLLAVCAESPAPLPGRPAVLTVPELLEAFPGWR